MTSDELNALAARIYRGDLSLKPASYLDEYHRLFQTIRLEQLRLLELGVKQGFSMQLWEEYFPNARIVGLDGEAKPPGFPEEDRFYFAHGAQDSVALLDEAKAWAGGPFDIIIDDASHLGCHSARSFAHLFPNSLKPGGIYIMEDICTAFTSGGDFDAAPYTPREIGLSGMPKVFSSHEHGMVGLVKQIIDHSQAPTACGNYTLYAIERVSLMTNIAFIHKAK